MLSWVRRAVAETDAQTTAMVVGPEFPADANGAASDASMVVQNDARGTGHALLQAESLLAGRCEHLLVLNADMPLITGDTLNRMMGRHLAAETPFTMLSCHLDEPGEMGRVIRNAGGEAAAIVEARDADPETLASNEVCCGAYCIRSEWAWPALKALQPAPNGEFYITSLVGAAAEAGFNVETVSPEDPTEALGVNDREDLARVAAIAFERSRRRLMAGGVTLVDPPSTFVDADVTVGVDTVLQQGVILQGETNVGEGCDLGPNAVIRDSRIGDGCRIQGSVIEEAEIADNVNVGPYSHLRPGARLGRGVHIGNYVEIKTATLGPDTKVGHFSYLGDAEIGARVNIGAGTVTCNYDGESKHKTVIGDDAFIGSDSMLVAPVTVGSRAMTGAGSVVTRDVPDGAKVFGVPARDREQTGRDEG